MDPRIRDLERKAAADPSFELALAQEYMRADLLLIPGQCDLDPNQFTAQRGLIEGNIYGCVAAITLFADLLLENSDYYDQTDKTANEWLARSLELLFAREVVAYDAIGRPKGNAMEFPNFWEGDFYVQQPRFDGINWVPAESVGIDTRSLYWRIGFIRKLGNGQIEWQGGDGRDIPGNNLVEFYFDSKTSCRIIYTQPTEKMREALCLLNPKFFRHRLLPPKPPLYEMDLSHVMPVTRQLVPFHHRGQLFLPDAQTLKYVHRQYQDASDPTWWVTYLMDTWPVCIRCPGSGCGQVYSVWQKGADYPNAFCEACQFKLIEPYTDDITQLRRFLLPHVRYQIMRAEGPTPRWFFHIPDCTPEERRQIDAWLKHNKEVLVPIGE